MPNDKTEWVWTNKSTDEQQGGGLPPLGGVGGNAGGNDETRLAQGATPASGGEEGADKTRIFVPEGAEGSEGASFDEGVDPVVGWLVVIEGPGRGRSVQLGAGANSVGRDASERAALPFGDDQITGQAHASIMYDDSSREFFITHVNGKNLTRLNGALVANLTPLKSGDVIELGKTTKLRFMAFCDTNFDWTAAS